VSRSRKQYLEVPLPMQCSVPYKLWVRLKGFLLSPAYLFLAGIAGVPGVSFHLRCAAMGIRLLLSGRVPLKKCYHYMFFPMDSVRYFEFHEAWKRLEGFAFSRYLDVSSPRILPLLLMETVPGATADLINPDANDLHETERLAEALGQKARCRFFNGVLDDSGIPPASFDLVTCLSVLEHIPEDTAALQAMWLLLRPGGKLILTMPCMSEYLEQYISHNPYGVLAPGDDGYTFWQRYYDKWRLETCVFPVTGRPAYVALYGEKKHGFFFRNAAMKRLLGSYYPFWREPYMMATEYRAFSSVDELPGEGVILLEFIKAGKPA
jgi:SAM-dependent methyltransferase